ncbi:MAG TPA: cytochrome c oxidase subunit II, partial [Acidimicrobiales bacterium]|nr:cytochrome c oxidase subunit II [Acidimicrobiales bacterium]
MRRSAVKRFGALGLLAILLAACSSEDTPQNVFRPEGTQAQKINDLQVPVFIAAGVVGVIVITMVVIIVWQFRSKRHAADEVPTQIHGNSKLEIAWTILPGVILLPIAVFTVATVFDLAQKPSDALVVDVVGQQWWWEFDYPSIKNADGQPIVTANEMVIPAGKNIQLSVTSRDVIHSFWIPRLNGKRDAVPNRIQPLRMQASEPGEYWGQCAEFCGLSHANMRIRVVALSEADWQRWIDNQVKLAVEPTTAEQKAGQATFLSL